MHLDLTALTVILQFVQNLLTVSNKLCNPTGVLAIRITSSAYIKEDISVPFESFRGDEFESSRSNSKLLTPFGLGENLYKLIKFSMTSLPC